MPQKNTEFIWKGEHEFQIIGTDHHEDTIKISANVRESKTVLKLLLPTLSITYADMKFTNAIGGSQEKYPESIKYGSKFFDPPIILSNEQDVEKYTWIRGAKKVTIGPKNTEIEWYIMKNLVIPRLRISREKPVRAVIRCDPISIDIDKELKIDVVQAADGRPIGGIRVEKRHPDWTPGQVKNVYNLSVRVTDSVTLQPRKEQPVNFFRWEEKGATPYGSGGFMKTGQKYTDGTGTIYDPGRVSGFLEAVTVENKGRASVARCFRALPGQFVRHTIITWGLVEDIRDYIWRNEDDLKSIAGFTGFGAEYILKLNNLSNPGSLKEGMTIHLPSYAASYQMSPGDTFEWLVEEFVYADSKELSSLNGLKDLTEWNGKKNILLPGWHFFNARHDDTLETIDKMFNLAEGCSRTLGRVYHPEPGLPFEAEIVAVPTLKFVKEHIDLFRH